MVCGVRASLRRLGAGLVRSRCGCRCGRTPAAPCKDTPNPAAPEVGEQRVAGPSRAPGFCLAAESRLMRGGC